jgi:hypothetical protein
MNLEEAKANIGAEVELDESTKPYTFMHDGIEYEKVNTLQDNSPCVIEGTWENGNVFIKGNTYRDVINPRHLKIKPQNYKIHVPTEEESREAQNLFFALGYNWRSGNTMPKYNSYSCIFTVGKIITVTDFAENGKNINAKLITIQDLKDMVAKKKGIKSIGVDLASGDDKTVKVTGKLQEFESRKEMTWEDAFYALIDGKEVEMVNVTGRWDNINGYCVKAIKSSCEFRIVPKRIALNGKHTKEEWLKILDKYE